MGGVLGKRDIGRASEDRRVVVQVHDGDVDRAVERVAGGVDQAQFDRVNESGFGVDGAGCDQVGAQDLEQTTGIIQDLECVEFGNVRVDAP